MIIDLKLGGQLRTTVGQENVAVEIADGAAIKLGTVLESLAQQHPDARDMLLTSAGAVAGGLLVLIDDAATAADCDLAIDAGAAITLLPAISGG